MNDEHKSAEQKIAQALTQVLPEDVWPVVLPQNPAYPAISFNRLNYERKSESADLNPLKLRTAIGEKSTFQVVIYDRQYTLCCQLLRQCRRELETAGFTLESVQDGFEFDQLAYAMVMEWSLWGDLAPDNRQPPGHWPVIETLTQAIITHLKNNMHGSITAITAYDPHQRQLITPGLVVDVKPQGAGESLGDGRAPLLFETDIHCLMPEGAQEQQVQGLAAVVYALIFEQSFGLKNLSLPDRFAIAPADGTAGETGFKRWLVSWQQTLYLGQSIWSDDGEVPGSKGVYAGAGKATGAEFEDQYEAVVPATEDE